MIEPDLPLLLQRRIIAQLHQCDFVRLLGVGRHEGGPAWAVLVGMQPEHVLVPFLRPLGVADVDVDVLQIHRSLAHRALTMLPASCGDRDGRILPPPFPPRQAGEG